jgi:hypothetical protein
MGFLKLVNVFDPNILVIGKFPENLVWGRHLCVLLRFRDYSSPSATPASVGLRKDMRHTLFAVGSKGLCIKRVLSKRASSVPKGPGEGFTTNEGARNGNYPVA